MKTKYKVGWLIGGFGILFLLTLYGWSLLFLLESHPDRNGDPTLQEWAWFAIVMIITEPIVFFVLLYRVLFK